MMYQTMEAMGYMGTSDFNGPIKLSGTPKGASVLILGAGLAGMTAAFELRKAGYKVQLLEYNDRPGGRNWSLYGGDTYTDIGGVSQEVKFAKGLYLNPGPWRLPHHHYGILYYCKLLNVALETFTMVNYNTYIHSTKAFGGEPKRRREIEADFTGYTSELLAKASSQSKLDGALTKDEKDGLLQILRFWGALDKNYQYKKSALRQRRARLQDRSGRRALGHAGRFRSAADAATVRSLAHILSSKAAPTTIQMQLFQPVGGMGMIGKAFGRALNGLIQYNCQGHHHPAGQQRRHRHLYRLQERRRAQDRPCRLVRLHHSGHGSFPDSHECGRADAQRHQPASL